MTLSRPLTYLVCDVLHPYMFCADITVLHGINTIRILSTYGVNDQNSLPCFGGKYHYVEPQA